MGQGVEETALNQPVLDDINSGSDHEQSASPFNIGQQSTELEVARLLIEAGADVNVKDDTQQSAYLIPTADGYLEFLKLTLQSGADVHTPGQEAPPEARLLLPELASIAER